MQPKDLAFLQSLAKTVNSWTEIGGYVGKSLMAVAQVLPEGALLQVVDKFLNHWRVENQSIFTTVDTILTHRPDLNVVLVRSDGIECSKFIAPTEVIFLDGCHSYDQVSKEIAVHKDRCEHLLGHDYDETKLGVVRAVDEYVKHSKRKLTVSGTVWTVK